MFILDTSTKSDYTENKYEIRLVGGNMDQEKKSGIYMSSYLCEFNRIFKEFNDIYHEVASRLGLSNSAFDIFYAICELGDGCLQRDICKTTFIPKQTVNSSIRNLEREGYLTLVHGKGRNMHIYLTERGKKMLKNVIYPVIDVENDSFKGLTDEESELLLRLLEKYNVELKHGFEKLPCIKETMDEEKVDGGR